MGKFWSILFGVAMGLCAGVSILSMFNGWWMPPTQSVHGSSIDGLFNFILATTAFFFFLTQGLLVLFMYKYGEQEGVAKPVRNKGVPAILKPIGGLVSDPHRVEIAWTIVPAIILLVLAISQIGAWSSVKYQGNKPGFEGKEVALQVDVSARQFEWRMRYPSPERFEQWMAKKDKKDYESFARHPQADDVYTVNELHLWKGHPMLVHLSTRDVLHSFNLPNFRVKQDALPGKVIPVWFTPTESSSNTKYVGQSNNEQLPVTAENAKYVYDIPCAELCGWGHYRMIGRVYVHDSQAEFLAWLQKAAAYTHQRTTDK